MTIILGRLVSQGKGPPPTKSRDSLITCSGDHVTNEENYTFNSTRPMATKLDKEVAPDEKKSSTKSHNPLIT